MYNPDKSARSSDAFRFMRQLRPHHYLFDDLLIDGKRVSREFTTHPLADGAEKTQSEWASFSREGWRCPTAEELYQVKRTALALMKSSENTDAGTPWMDLIEEIQDEFKKATRESPIRFMTLTSITKGSKKTIVTHFDGSMQKKSERQLHSIRFFECLEALYRPGFVSRCIGFRPGIAGDEEIYAYDTVPGYGSIVLEREHEWIRFPSYSAKLPQQVRPTLEAVLGEGCDQLGTILQHSSPAARKMEYIPRPNPSTVPYTSDSYSESVDIGGWQEHQALREIVLRYSPGSVCNMDTGKIKNGISCAVSFSCVFFDSRVRGGVESKEQFEISVVPGNLRGKAFGIRNI